jgi:hypothetical protein
MDALKKKMSSSIAPKGKLSASLPNTDAFAALARFMRNTILTEDTFAFAAQQSKTIFYKIKNSQAQKIHSN